MADASSILEPSPLGPDESPSRPDGRQFDPLAQPPRSRIDELLRWLAGQPLVPPALGLVAGIALDAAWSIPIVVLVPLLFAAGAAIGRLRTRDGLRHLAVALAALCIGALLHDLTYRRWPADCIVRYCGSTSTPARVTGTVLASPLIRQPQMGRIDWFGQSPITRMLIEAESLEGTGGSFPVSGTVSVKVDEPVLAVRSGDRVELFGRMYRPPGPDGAEERDWARLARRNGVLVEMSCDHAANVAILPQSQASRGWRGLLTTVRQRARAAMLDRAWPGEAPGSNLLEALVLGQRRAVDPSINQAFVDTGTVHYLSVSGAHVGMLASVLWGAAVLTGLSRRATAFWIAIVITAYGILAEPNPPVWRSVIMGDLLCMAVLLRRPVRVANWLALSAIVLLVLHPTDLFDPGFQLSFGTLVSLIYLGPPIGRAIERGLRRLRGVSDPLLAPEIQRMFDPHPVRRIGWAVERFLAVSLGVGFSAWLASVAPGAYHFYQVSLWGWLNTLLLAPLVWLALVIGLLKTVLGWVWPVLGIPLGLPLTWVTELLIRAVHLLTALPGSPLPPLYVSGIGVAAFTIMLVLWTLREWLRLPRGVLQVGTLVFVVIAAWRMAPRGHSRELRVDILSVGSGSAHLIELPNGRNLLYDLGSRPPYDLQRWTVGPMLAHENIYRLDALVLSHPDLDHFSSVPDLLDREWVSRLLTSDSFRRLATREGPAGRLIRDVEARRLPWQHITRGQAMDGSGEVRIECLWPPPSGELPASLSTNDSSVVLRISYAGCRILLCGDIEDFAQRRLIQNTDVHADVLVLPHHGAVTAYTRSFISAVDPVWCIRSSGLRDADTHNGLLSAVAGRRYLNTAEDGSVRIRVSSTGLVVSASRERH